MTLSLADIKLWERKADKLEKWLKTQPYKWVEANNKRFPTNKGFALHEIDTSIEPLKGFDDILRRLRWEKPNIADVVQEKYDEFFTNMQECFSEIPDGYDCSETVIVLRTNAHDLAKELQKIAAIARDELKAELASEQENAGQENIESGEQVRKITKLTDFFHNCCEDIPSISSKANRIHEFVKKGKIKFMPKTVNKPKQNETKLYYEEELRQIWPKLKEKIKSLPNLKD